MLRRPKTMLLLAFAFLVRSAISQESGDQYDQQLDQVIELARSGDFARAIGLADSLANARPDFAQVWWIRGQLFIHEQMPDSAARAWERYRQLEPDDWRVLPNLIQAYQSEMDSIRRDERRGTLFQLYEEGKDTSLTSQSEYLRDAFVIDTLAIEVYEQFKPSGDRQVFIWFYLFDSKGKQVANFSLGSFEQDNQFARELGQIKDGERIYHLDFNSPKGHSTYGMYLRKPSYDSLRRIVVGAVQGTIAPQSSSSFK
jgi:hypothetical protein